MVMVMASEKRCAILGFSFSGNMMMLGDYLKTEDWPEAEKRNEILLKQAEELKECGIFNSTMLDHLSDLRREIVHKNSRKVLVIHQGLINEALAELFD
jgi:hypothetical protein